MRKLTEVPDTSDLFKIIRAISQPPEAYFLENEGECLLTSISPVARKLLV